MSWRGLEETAVSSPLNNHLIKRRRGGKTAAPLVPAAGAVIIPPMRIISRKTLREFWEKYPDAEQSLRAWYANANRADWQSPADIKLAYRNSNIVANNRVVFNIKGNHYRLVVAVNYDYGMLYIRFVGTHKAYDQIDVTTI